MKKTSSSGFTLIELLVVIAVIGILASVVLVSLRSAQNKAIDKAIQENMLSIRTQATLYINKNSSFGATPLFPNPGSYNCSTSMFSADPIIQAAVNKIRTYRGYDNIYCLATANTYAVAAQLKSSDDYYCIDSNNAGKVIPVASAGNGLFDLGQNNAAMNMNTALCY